MTLLSNLTGLQELNLEGNRICDHIHITDALEPHKLTLEYLGLIDNCLSEFPDLSQMLKLQKLYLAHNNISDADSGSLPPSLTHLYLFFNHLTRIPRSVSNMTGLQWLDLDNNNISSIEDLEFPSTMFLMIIQHNNIHSISSPMKFLNNSSHLETFYLADNPISHIDINAFRWLSNLTYLSLSETRITRLPLALAALTNIQYLILNDIANLTCTCQEASLATWYHSRPYMALPGQCDDVDIKYFLDKLAGQCPD